MWLLGAISRPAVSLTREGPKGRSWRRKVAISLRPLATGVNYTIASIREPNENAWRMLLNKYRCMLQMQSSNIISDFEYGRAAVNCMGGRQ